MTCGNEHLKWDSKAETKYKAMLEKIPLFHRKLTQEVVDKKSPLNAEARGATQVEEVDIVHAFLTEVPKAFYSLMIRLMDEVGFDYKSVESGD